MDVCGGEGVDSMLDTVGTFCTSDRTRNLYYSSMSATLRRQFMRHWYAVEVMFASLLFVFYVLNREFREQAIPMYCFQLLFLLQVA